MTLVILNYVAAIAIPSFFALVAGMKIYLSLIVPKPPDIGACDAIDIHCASFTLFGRGPYCVDSVYSLVDPVWLTGRFQNYVMERFGKPVADPDIELDCDDPGDLWFEELRRCYVRRAGRFRPAIIWMSARWSADEPFHIALGVIEEIGEDSFGLKIWDPTFSMWRGMPLEIEKRYMRA